jgi:AraC-like DNA-binding protein
MPSPLDRLLGPVRASHYHQLPGRHPVPNLMRPNQEMVEVMTGGRGWVEEAGGTWRELAAGDLLWHVTGEPTIGRSDFRDPYRCLSVSFTVEPGHPRPIERCTRWQDLAELRTFTRLVVAMVAEARLDSRLVATTIYSRLLIEAERWRLGANSDGLPDAVIHVRGLIDGNHTQDLSVERLAAEVDWSPQHLHAMFRRHLGITPHQYVLERRLQSARELLASGTESVAIIAARTGFSSAAVFCRAFRNATGKSPGAWRRTRG